MVLVVVVVVVSLVVVLLLVVVVVVVMAVVGLVVVVMMSVVMLLLVLLLLLLVQLSWAMRDSADPGRLGLSLTEYAKLFQAILRDSGYIDFKGLEGETLTDTWRTSWDMMRDCEECI